MHCNLHYDGDREIIKGKRGRGNIHTCILRLVSVTTSMNDTKKREKLIEKGACLNVQKSG